MNLHPLSFSAAAALIMLPLSSIASAEVSKAELESISIPDRVDTPIGELKCFDGVPTDATIDGSSQDKGFEQNADGSYDLYFAPKAPKGKEGNWLQTVSGKSWFTILRMYGPLEPWINKSRRPSEIELVK